MIPIDIQNDAQLYSIHVKIVSLRSTFHSKMSDINTGTFSVKNDILTIITQLQNELLFMNNSIIRFYIPTTSQTDFINGVISLMNYITDETVIDYYSENIKVFLYLNVIAVNIKTIAAYATTSINGAAISAPSHGGKITEDDFITQGTTSPTKEIRYTYIFHTVSSGDTLRSIAQQYLGDPNFAIDVARANDLRPSDFISGLAGQKIRIPVPANSNITSSKRVFEYLPEGRDNATIEKYLYGQDISLENKKIVLSGNDAATISGKSVIIQNLKNKFSSIKIGLTPSEPLWGIGTMEANNDIPYLVQLERYLTRAENQCMMDSRITDAFVDRRKGKIIIDGENTRYSVKLKLYAGDTLEVSNG